MVQRAAFLRRAVAGLAASAVAARTSGVHATAAGSATTANEGDGRSLLGAALSYKELFRGQLAPPLPSSADASSTESGPVVFDRGIGWQAGAYGSLWLRLGLGPGAAAPTSAEVLSPALDEALARTEGKAAVYVGIQELALDPSVSSLLRQRGFRYHHFRHAPPEGKAFGVGGGGWRTGEHVYYRWNGDPSHDMVPAYCTSIEGVGGLVLSPDESKVLLIWEYGHWKPITGAVDDGESALGACRREMREEAGVAADASFRPVFVGGWQMARARDDRVNDNFKVRHNGGSNVPAAARFRHATTSTTLAASLADSAYDGTCPAVCLRLRSRLHSRLRSRLRSRSRTTASRVRHHLLSLIAPGHVCIGSGCPQAFVLRAASEAFTVDQNEVSEARWFGVDQLRALYAANGRPPPSGARVVEDPTLPEGRRKVSVNGLAWLQTYCDGHGLSVDVIRRPGTDAEWTFIGGRGASKASGQPRQQRAKL